MESKTGIRVASYVFLLQGLLHNLREELALEVTTWPLLVKLR